MADYGLKVVNSAGYVQIDSTFKNLGLRVKGSVVSGGSPTASGWYQATITVPAGSTPVLAVRPSSGYATQISATTANGYITYTYYCSAAGITLSYWVFDDPLLSGASGQYGLIVRNSGGSTVFDSRIDYMRVLGVFSGTGDTTPIESGYSLNLPSGATPAVVQSQLRYRWTAQLIDNQTILAAFVAAAFSISGASVSFSSQVINSFNAPNSTVINTTPSNAYSYLFIDVTNM